MKTLHVDRKEPLRILAANFQSIRNLKEELDIVLGSETHLTSCITESDILNPMQILHHVSS